MSEQLPKFDVAVVGGGIAGLAHAWMAVREGSSVVLFERNRIACGASVRNFGMIWPIGQPAGELHDLAITSRKYWLQLAVEANLNVAECGSIHLARDEDEHSVLEEFVAACESSNELTMLTPDEVARKSPAAHVEGLRAGMWSATELCVSPVAAIAGLSRFLAEAQGVEIRSPTTVINIEDNLLTTACGQQTWAERIVVCTGSDFETLYPELFNSSGLTRCKLQMLATAAQPNGWRLGPHLAGGLTLRHYRSFEHCPSLSRLRSRIAREKPLLDRYGIHVMASQNDRGEVILGDSHLYGDDITPFDSQEIDDLILEEINQLMQFPDSRIWRRWHGVYAKHPDQPVLILQPATDCKLITALGGAGMTLSFAIAERTWQNWEATEYV